MEIELRRGTVLIDRVPNLASGFARVMVPIDEVIRGFNMILDGEVDDLPEQAFLNVGTIDDAIEKGKKLMAQA